MNKQDLENAAAEKILILDGAMGTMVQKYRSPEGNALGEEDFRGERFADHHKPLKGCNEILCLTRPDIIQGIHEAYLEAGADIIETCSFNATSVSLKDFGLESLSRELSKTAAALARKAADRFSFPKKRRFVAGSMGPTSKSAVFTPDLDNPGKRQISWDELEAAYYENAWGLVEGGADFLLIETVFDCLNARAALSAIKRLSKKMGREIPVMVSATVSEAGRLLTGQTAEAFCASILYAEPWAVGLNCSFGAEALKTTLEKISAFASLPVGFFPNAGLPDGKGIYSDTPELMAAAAELCMKEGLINIIGGCCGSTPDHIAAIAEKARNHKPRSVPVPRKNITLAGTEIFEVKDENFLKISGAVPWQEALNRGDYEEAIEIARDTEGLAILFVCADKAPDPRGTVKNFIFLASAYSDLSKLPVFIESTNLKVIEEGLKCFQGRGLARYLPAEQGPEAVTPEEAICKIEDYGAMSV